MMNKVILIGRLTKDPELRHTTSGAATCTITVAVDRMPDQNGQRQADFISVVTWNKQAENIAKYLNKGRLIAVDGRIQTRNYDDKDGKRVYVTEVLANNVQFLESKNSVEQNNNYQNATPSYQPTYESIENNNQNINTVDLDNDPFASFGDSISVDQLDNSENDLPF